MINFAKKKTFLVPIPGWGFLFQPNTLYTTPLPASTHENGENLPKRGKLLRTCIFVSFLHCFPNLGGSDREGNFVILAHFPRISAPEASQILLGEEQLVDFGEKTKKIYISLLFRRVEKVRTEKQPKDRVFGQDILGHQGPTRRDIPDPVPENRMFWTKTLCKAPFSVVFLSDKEWPGCPAVWVRTSRDQKTFPSTPKCLQYKKNSCEELIS